MHTKLPRQRTKMAQVRIVGLLKDPSFHRCRVTAETLKQKHPATIDCLQVEALFEFQWAGFLAGLKQEHHGKIWKDNETVIVFLDNNILGSCEEFLSWSKQHLDHTETRPLSSYSSLAKDAYNSYLTDNKERDCVFLDISVEGEPYGQLVLELFKTLCPRTCANFKALCTGEMGECYPGVFMSYTSTVLHRIVANGWIQGGDIHGGSGAGGSSIYGDVFEDECFAVEHDSRGVLGMVNQGPNTNSSQFYITLKASPWMNKQYVAFGRVIEGSKVLKKLEMLETYNERPQKEAIVRKCGAVQPVDTL